MQTLMKKKEEEEIQKMERSAAQMAVSDNENSGLTGPPEIDPTEIDIEQQVGVGSFGKVFKGRCRQKPVAVKVLHKQNLDNKTLLAFRREVKIMSKIFHPNICLFMGACTVPGRCMIVTELLPKGDLESILRDKQHYPNLSLIQRMKMARDAAFGMNWLHCSNPVFIHRDLKSSNLLVDDNMNVKVCDFGLSQLIPRFQKVKDKQNAKGTPLWMAPEVMMFKEFNEKCDVYSYGIVLWEILTRDEPFSEYQSFDRFKEAVCVKHERPPVPADTVPSLKALIESCWAAEPSQRPSFMQIINQLDVVIVDCAINDPIGRQFWKQFFLKKEEVTWQEFADALDVFLGYKTKNSNNVTYTLTAKLSNISLKEKHNLNMRCLHALLAEAPKRENAVGEVVNIEQFGKILDWFGPLDDPNANSNSNNNNNNNSTPAVSNPDSNINDNKSTISNNDNNNNNHNPDDNHERYSDPQNTLLDRIRLVLMKNWFHGDLSTNDAQMRLGGLPGGSYLVRFSTTQPGSYTISSITKADTTSIKHQRVSFVAGSGFNYNNQWYQSLEDIIRATDYLMIPCPGSKFQFLFVDQPHSIIGYT